MLKVERVEEELFIIKIAECYELKVKLEEDGMTILALHLSKNEYDFHLYFNILAGEAIPEFDSVQEDMQDKVRAQIIDWMDLNPTEDFGLQLVSKVYYILAMGDA